MLLLKEHNQLEVYTEHLFHYNQLIFDCLCYLLKIKFLFLLENVIDK